MSSYTLQRSLLPTWERFRRLFAGATDLSILRSLEYELLGQTRMSGRILDFGGGNAANYRDLVRTWAAGCVYETANIDPSIEPTYLLAPGQALPVEGCSFDIVVTLNTLEHIYDIEETLRDLLRVLKPGGVFVATVPFLFRIHGHPDDFLRGTPSWWGRTLASVAFSEIVITPLLWGPMSTGLSVAGIPGPLKRLRLQAALLFDLLNARRHYHSDEERYGGSVGEAICNAPLGFLIHARKPPQAPWA